MSTKREVPSLERTLALALKLSLPDQARLAQRLLEHKYYFDEAYDWAFVRPLDRVAGFGSRSIELPVIDAAVVDTGLVARAGATALSLTQSGYFRNYVLVFVGGALVAALILIVRANS